MLILLSWLWILDNVHNNGKLLQMRLYLSVWKETSINVSYAPTWRYHQYVSSWIIPSKWWRLSMLHYNTQPTSRWWLKAKPEQQSNSSSNLQSGVHCKIKVLLRLIFLSDCYVKCSYILRFCYLPYHFCVTVFGFLRSFNVGHVRCSQELHCHVWEMLNEMRVEQVFDAEKFVSKKKLEREPLRIPVNETVQTPSSRRVEDSASTRPLTAVSHSLAALPEISHLTTICSPRPTPSIPSSISNIEQECILCYDEQATIMLIPCGHLAYCVHCSPRLKLCAICHLPIRATLLTRFV